MGKLEMGRRGVWHHHAMKPGAFSREMAGHRVFESNGARGVGSEGGQRGQIDIGGGFSGCHVVDATNGIKGIKETEAREVGLDVRMVRVGGDPESEPAGPRGYDQCLDAGKRGLLSRKESGALPVFAFQSRPVRRGIEGQPWIETDAHMSHDVKEQ